MQTTLSRFYLYLPEPKLKQNNHKKTTEQNEFFSKTS